MSRVNLDYIMEDIRKYKRENNVPHSRAPEPPPPQPVPQEEPIIIQEESIEEDDIQTKLDIINLTNGWNDKNEKFIVSIGENAASYKWMHEKSQALYSTTSKVLSLLVIILNTGLSAQTILPNIAIQSDFKDAINLSQNIFIYMVTIISVIQNFLKYEELATKHNTCASNFGLLYHEIQQQMCTYRKERFLASKYISDVLKRYDNLVVNSPKIGGIILYQFKSRVAKTNDIAVPDIADKIQKIDILTETPQQATRGIQLNTLDLSKNYCDTFDITDKDVESIVSNKKRRLESRIRYENERARNFN